MYIHEGASFPSLQNVIKFMSRGVKMVSTRAMTDVYRVQLYTDSTWSRSDGHHDSLCQTADAMLSPLYMLTASHVRQHRFLASPSLPTSVIAVHTRIT